MSVRLRLRPGLAKRLRETRAIPSEDAQARLIGVDRTTLRRVDAGDQPSGAFVAQFCVAFGLGLGEAFEIVDSTTELTDTTVDRNAAFVALATGGGHHADKGVA